MINKISNQSLAILAGRCIEKIHVSGVTPEELTPFFDFMDSLIRNSRTKKEIAENLEALRALRFTCISGLINQEHIFIQQPVMESQNQIAFKQ